MPRLRELTAGTDFSACDSSDRPGGPALPWPSHLPAWSSTSAHQAEIAVGKARPSVIIESGRGRCSAFFEEYQRPRARRTAPPPSARRWTATGQTKELDLLHAVPYCKNEPIFNRYMSAFTPSGEHRSICRTTTKPASSGLGISLRLKSTPKQEGVSALSARTMSFSTMSLKTPDCIVWIMTMLYHMLKDTDIRVRDVGHTCDS